jgi:hypothetical protein
MPPLTTSADTQGSAENPMGEKKVLYLSMQQCAEVLGVSTKVAKKMLIREHAARKFSNGYWYTSEEQLLNAFPEARRRLTRQLAPTRPNSP